MIRQYSDWMRDNWNHPSVAVWDANNETKDPVFGDRIIPAVRGLDLSDRNWENSYNQPVGPDDPIEDHPYLMQGEAMGGEPFRMTDLERRYAGPKEPLMAAHATILNEYGWLWLRRDGEPTLLTEKLYPKLLGPRVDEGRAAGAERLPSRRQDRVLARPAELRGHPPLRVPDLQLPGRLHRRPLRGREGAEAQPVVRGLHGRRR